MNELIANWHLHGAGLLVGTALCGHLETVGPPLACGPVFGSQFLHEVLQTDDSMEGRQGFQLKELTVGNMDLNIQECQLDGPWEAVQVLP